jgi:hypothetical protein
MASVLRPTNLIGALLIGLCILYAMPHVVLVTGRNDFAHFYIGGLLYGTPDIHSAEVNQQKQVELTGVVMSNSYFIRPTFYGFLLKPFSWLPYYPAYLVFQAISLFCLALFLWTFAPGHNSLVTLAVMSPPLIANFVLGQDVMLLLGFLTITILLARKHADFAAGLVLSLCAIKFHLFLLLPAAVLFQRRWKILGGGATGGLVLFIIGLGSGGLVVYKGLFDLLRKPVNHPLPAIMPNLRGFVYAIAGENTPLLVTLWLVTAAAVLFLAWRAESFEVAFSYCLIGGVLVNFHSYMQDCLLLLFAMALLTDRYESKSVMRLLMVALLPFPYIFLYAGPPYSIVFHLLPIFTLIAAVRWYTSSKYKAPVVALAAKPV